MKVRFSLIDEKRGTFQIAMLTCKLYRGNHRRCSDGTLREVAVEIANEVCWVPAGLLTADDGNALLLADLEAAILREQEKGGLVLQPVDTCNTRCRECPCLDNCNTEPAIAHRGF